MTRRLLINAIHSEEKRVAICDDNLLTDLDIVWSDQVQLKGNIYKASITRVEPSLQAAFLDIGSSKNGFLQTNDIHPAYWNNLKNNKNDDENDNHYHRRFNVQDVLKTGQELIVQVVKDERDAKGATLTTNLSIPGRYCVLVIGNQRGGVSRKIQDLTQRKQMRQIVQKLHIPAGIGVIIRTAGINKTILELQKDVDNLVDLWVSIIQKSEESKSPYPLYKESDISIRALRDYLTSDIDEVLIDDKDAFDKAYEFMAKTAPKFINRLSHYKDSRPLFGKYNIDEQIEEINSQEVRLQSGGSIVIMPTEAVVTVDVNSGRSTGQSDIEETAFTTNKEAAYEIARQLKLRDLAGLVVVDFIDMFNRRHKQIIERIMKEATKNDRAKIEVGRISKFGLLELSRQRLKTPLISQSHMICPHCDGRGRVKNTEVVALEALRKIQSAISTGGVSVVKVSMPPAPALFLLNNKKDVLSALEKSMNVQILILADGRIKPDKYELKIDFEKTEEQIKPEQSNSYRQNRNFKNNNSDGRREPRERKNTGYSRQSRTPRDNSNPERPQRMYKAAQVSETPQPSLAIQNSDTPERDKKPNLQDGGNASQNGGHITQNQNQENPTNTNSVDVTAEQTSERKTFRDRQNDRQKNTPRTRHEARIQRRNDKREARFSKQRERRMTPQVTDDNLISTPPLQAEQTVTLGNNKTNSEM